MSASGSEVIGRRRTLRLVVRIGISGVLLFLLYREVPFAAVAETLARADRPRVLAAAGLLLAAHVVMAWRLRVLTDWQGLRLGTGRLLEIDLVTAFYRLFVPGGTVASIAVRFHKLHQAERNWSAALSAILFERVLATLAAASVGTVCFFADRPPLPATLGTILVGSVAVVAALAAALLHPASARAASWLAARLRVDALTERVERATGAVAAFRSLPRGRVLLLAGFAIGPHLIGTAVYWLLGSALEVPVGAAAFGWIRATALLASMLPLSLAGLGIRDVTLVVLLGFYGVADDVSLSLALLVFAVTVLLPSAVGAGLEARLVWRRRGSPGP
ncbi:MAG: lysylphosphatidylglycerol synthase transmembrane domain-containing protein [Proteobacteria bacterium]|nr:lysylphosphatidylglycerol synthase transmembrane domain-containing protein [Pseudomonadota bacterium]